ncbi:MAG: hypothetical protein DVB28_000851 [Verrucomicrobia bacterium]|nr:MAG: hypothetical protein DVB28_000851 [Verrucomicrobiota bacterium]
MMPRKVSSPTFLSHINVLFLLCLGVLLSACSSLQEVRVSAAPSLRRASIQVDIAGVNQLERGIVEGAPISKYFQPGNTVRLGLQTQAMRFGGDQPFSQSVTAESPVWKGWLAKKSVDIVVLADVPGVFDDLPGEADPRRKILPLSGKTAPKGVVNLEIFEGGLRFSNP